MKFKHYKNNKNRGAHAEYLIDSKSTRVIYVKDLECSYWRKWKGCAKLSDLSDPIFISELNESEVMLELL